MKFENYIAKRYFLSKNRVNFITIISFISILGITIGVAALIIVLSVFNGFSSLVTSYLISIDPHIRIENISPEKSYNEKDLMSKVNQVGKVTSFSPYVSGKVLAFRKGLTEVVNIKGIDENTGNKLYNLRENTIYGTSSLNSNEELPRIVLGLRLADKLEVITGDTLTLISAAGVEDALMQFSLPNSYNFIVEGIFNSNNNEYDASYMFTSLKPAQSLLGYNNRVQGYELKLDNIEQSEDVKEELKSILDTKIVSVKTWYDFHKDLYSVMQIEKWAAYIILSFIIAIAVFNVLGSLTMSIHEKKRDIGILRSMGANEKSIMRIFLLKGIYLGIIGTFSGALIGLIVIVLQLKTKFYPLDPTQYKIDALPVELRLTDFIFVIAASMILTFLASIYPAKKAVKINPLDAIKWE
ncbi:MAG TPA: ABC transporter permease [Ignavibacteriaceae bacterium]|nr:ABC transporter permease [Ignavibacteriaceae bacterium]